jgi:uncharacterized protein (DUF302 family)
MIRTLTLFLLLSLSINSFATEGIITLRSKHDFIDTVDRLETVLRAKEVNIFTEVDHTASANKVGENLLPTLLVIFGNPAVGTQLMQCSQSVGIDLPQKILVWENAQGEVYLSYNDVDYLAKRHDIKNCRATLDKISKALHAIATLATD